MADLKIRDVSDATVAFYRQRAKAKGMSLEEELRQTLDGKANARAAANVGGTRRVPRAAGRKYGIMPDSTPGIRAERDGEPDA